MISKECLYAYREMYPEHTMGYLEPGDLLGLEAEGRSLIQPWNETDRKFMRRLKKCTKERNLFLEEWPVDTTDYENMEL